jgi:replicative DNA helicase
MSDKIYAYKIRDLIDRLNVYRDAYYNKESTRQNISECIVAKNRHGETGTVELVWNGQFTRFSNLETNQPPEG